MSLETSPMVAANMAVTPPMMVTIIITSGECSKIGKNRATKKTPAVTIVAA